MNIIYPNISKISVPGMSDVFKIKKIDSTPNGTVIWQKENFTFVCSRVFEKSINWNTTETNVDYEVEVYNGTRYITTLDTESLTIENIPNNTGDTIIDITNTVTHSVTYEGYTGKVSVTYIIHQYPQERPVYGEVNVMNYVGGDAIYSGINEGKMALYYATTSDIDFSRRASFGNINDDGFNWPSGRLQYNHRVKNDYQFAPFKNTANGDINITIGFDSNIYNYSICIADTNLKRISRADIKWKTGPDTTTYVIPAGYYYYFNIKNIVDTWDGSSGVKAPVYLEDLNVDDKFKFSIDGIQIKFNRTIDGIDAGHT